MADDLRMALEELVSKAQLNQDEDFLRDGVRVLSQALMELEVSHRLGAERYQRTSGRKGQRNGYRERTWDTRVGTIELQLPRVRGGPATRLPGGWPGWPPPSGATWTAPTPPRSFRTPTVRGETAAPGGGGLGGHGRPGPEGPRHWQDADPAPAPGHSPLRAQVFRTVMGSSGVNRPPRGRRLGRGRQF